MATRVPSFVTIQNLELFSVYHLHVMSHFLNPMTQFRNIPIKVYTTLITEKTQKKIPQASQKKHQ